MGKEPSQDERCEERFVELCAEARAGKMDVAKHYFEWPCSAQLNQMMMLFLKTC